MSTAKALRIAQGLARLAKAEALRALAAVDEWAGVPEDERIGTAPEPEKPGDCVHHQDAPAGCTHKPPVASCPWCIVERLTKENEALRKPAKRATRAKPADAQRSTPPSRTEKDTDHG